MKGHLCSHPGDIVTLVSRTQKAFPVRTTSRRSQGHDRVSQECPCSLVPWQSDRKEVHHPLLDTCLLTTQSLDELD